MSNDRCDDISTRKEGWKHGEMKEAETGERHGCDGLNPPEGRSDCDQSAADKGEVKDCGRWRSAEHAANFQAPFQSQCVLLSHTVWWIMDGRWFVTWWFKAMNDRMRVELKRTSVATPPSWLISCHGSNLSITRLPHPFDPKCDYNLQKLV